MLVVFKFSETNEVLGVNVTYFEVTDNYLEMEIEESYSRKIIVCNKTHQRFHKSEDILPIEILEVSSKFLADYLGL